MTISHLVLCGGGPSGFVLYGAARHLSQEKYWNIKNIKTIYGCSIGSFMGVLLALNYDWNVLDDYFIKRPWEKIASVGPKEFISAFNQKGILGPELIIQSIQPLIEAKDLSITMTMQELYEFTKIEQHMYTIDLNQPVITKIDISHKTHPNLKVIDALLMTTAFPILFQPKCEGKSCFIDGGLINNLPVNDCLEHTQCNKDEILVFKNIYGGKENVITSESTLIEFTLILVKKMVDLINTEEKQTSVPNTVRCLLDTSGDYGKWLESLTQQENREQLIQTGMNCAKMFLEYIQN